jgi:hypothetical protein
VRPKDNARMPRRLSGSLSRTRSVKTYTPTKRPKAFRACLTFRATTLPRWSRSPARVPATSMRG